MRIEPDYKILEKYMKLVRRDTYLFLFDYLQSNIENFNSKLIELLENNNLTDHCYNLIYFAGHFCISYNLIESDIETKNKNPFDDFNNDLFVLKNFIQDKQCDKIEFSSPIQTIKINSEYLINDLMLLVKRYSESKKEFPQPKTPIDLKNIFPKEQSHYKNFAIQLLKILFPYLKENTAFQNKSNNETYQFLIDFTELLNVDWDNFSEFPVEYLKDRHKEL